MWRDEYQYVINIDVLWWLVMICNSISRISYIGATLRRYSYTDSHASSRYRMPLPGLSVAIVGCWG